MSHTRIHTIALGPHRHGGIDILTDAQVTRVYYVVLKQYFDPKFGMVVEGS